VFSRSVPDVVGEAGLKHLLLNDANAPDRLMTWLAKFIDEELSISSAAYKARLEM
jgi:hypothetical protein